MRGKDWGSVVAEAGAGGVALRSELTSAGVSGRAMEGACERGWLIRLRQGAYTSRERWAAANPRQRHRLILLAHQRVVPHLVVAGLSAAVVLDLPLPRGVPPAPILTTARQEDLRGAAGRRAGAVGRRSWLDDDEVIERNGLRVTDPARTVIDCARVCSYPWTLAIADAAAAGLGLRGSLVGERLAQAPPMPGKRRAGWAAAHMKSVVESPLESLPRALIIRAGLPEPQPQAWIGTRLGRFRVDLLEHRHRVITEADGRIKYDSPEVLWEEKRREDALRAAGYTVVRFTMADLGKPQRWMATYRQARALCP